MRPVTPIRYQSSICNEHDMTVFLLSSSFCSFLHEFPSAVSTTRGNSRPSIDSYTVKQGRLCQPFVMILCSKNRWRNWALSGFAAARTVFAHGCNERPPRRRKAEPRSKHAIFDPNVWTALGNSRLFPSALILLLSDITLRCCWSDGRVVHVHCGSVTVIVYFW